MSGATGVANYLMASLPKGRLKAATVMPLRGATGTGYKSSMDVNAITNFDYAQLELRRGGVIMPLIASHKVITLNNEAIPVTVTEKHGLLGKSWYGDLELDDGWEAYLSVNLDSGGEVLEFVFVVEVSDAPDP